MMDIKEIVNKEHCFIKANYEKTLRLVQVILKLFEEEELKRKLVLKGGAAVAFHVGELKRLFFDADVDFFIPDFQEYQNEKAKFYEQFFLLMKNLNYFDLSSKSRHSFSLDSFSFPYVSNKNKEYVKVEVNYSLGNHLFPAITKQYLDQEIYVVQLKELLGMKIKALLERGAIKDLFDIYQLITVNTIHDFDDIRKSYLFYYTLATIRENPASLENVYSISTYDVMRKLYPMIPKHCGFDLAKCKKEVLAFLKELLCFSKEELSFISYFQQGIYVPENLFQDKEVVQRAQKNPFALYKIMVKNKS